MPVPQTGSTGGSASQQRLLAVAASAHCGYRLQGQEPSPSEPGQGFGLSPPLSTAWVVSPENVSFRKT